MSQLIIRSQKPSEIQKFVKNNDSSKLASTAGDSLKAYQKANGGTGATFHDLEKSWIKTQGYNTIDDFMNSLGYIVGVIRQRVFVFLQSILSVSTSYYLLEDGTSKYQLEDGSGFYILE